MFKLLGKNINDTAKLIRVFVNSKLDKYQLGDGQFALLHQISINEGLSQEKLSVLHNVDKATVTKSVKKLIRNGYIYREKNVNDGRAYKLYCTQKGLNFLPTIYNILDLKERLLASHIDVEELLIFKKVLNQIDSNITDYLKKEKEKNG